MRNPYGWLVIAVVFILSIISLMNAINILKTVTTLGSGEGVGDVTGRLVNEEGDPLEGAYVWIEKEHLSTLTDENGNFTLKGVGTGIHTINFWKLGYERRSEPVSVFPESMTVKWEGLNDVGEISLKEELEVHERELSPAALHLNINYTLTPDDMHYTLLSSNGTVSASGDLEENLTLSSLIPGTYTLNITGDNRTWALILYLPPGGKSLEINLDSPGEKRDLRTLSTITLVPGGENLPDWILINLTDRNGGLSFERKINTTDSITLSVREGLYNLTLGSPYTDALLFSNISTPGTLQVNLSYRKVEERSYSLTGLTALAVVYLIIGVIGILGAVTVYFRSRFYVALASLVLLMIVPSPVVFPCFSLSVLLSLAAILMLYRIREEFQGLAVTGASSVEEE